MSPDNFSIVFGEGRGRCGPDPERAISDALSLLNARKKDSPSVIFELIAALAAGNILLKTKQHPLNGYQLHDLDGKYLGWLLSDDRDRWTYLSAVAAEAANDNAA